VTARLTSASGRSWSEGLLSGRATDPTIVLAKRAVAARERTFGHTIEGYVTLAAAQKNRAVATVRVAKPLSSDQRKRLRGALSKQIGREVAIQEVVDPDILGGVRVEVGDEVFEGPFRIGSRQPDASSNKLGSTPPQ
jgi:F-type H+-transporting ATPase subunit delta